MRIDVNNQIKTKIDLILIKKIVKKFLTFFKKTTKEVSIAFVDEKEMRRLNRIYRGVDKTTDVLSFPEIKNKESDSNSIFLGEVILDYAQIKKQAKEQGHGAWQELVFVLVHGLLHLIGYEDKTEQERMKMIKIGKDFISKAKL